jgi:hypothetical protein
MLARTGTEWPFLFSVAMFVLMVSIPSSICVYNQAAAAALAARNSSCASLAAESEQLRCNTARDAFS